MEGLSHDNILMLYEVIDSPDHHKIHLVLEYAAGGSLYDKLPVKEEKGKVYFRQLIAAIEYLHDIAKVVHRDIKPHNILLSSKDEVKLCDFGSAQMLGYGKDELTYSAGTYPFMAPELHGGSKTFKGTATDIWACGITLYFMIENKTPYASRKSLDLAEEVKNKHILLPSHFSQDLRDLLNKMLDRNPDTRATISDIKNSEWFVKD